MHQLSGLDATFLFLETPEMPMHVGALQLLELPSGTRGKFAVALRKHVASRLVDAPVLRRRLWWMPLNMANPAWVDADPDLREHIVEVKLAKGAGMPALEAQVAALHTVLLDRERPLWKMHVFDGLAPGPDGSRRVAVYTQLHHAAVDGQAAVALANVLLDLSPEPRKIDRRLVRSGRSFRLDMSQMLRGALGAQAQKVAQIVRELPSTVGTLKDAALLAASRARLLGSGKGTSNLTLAPRTPLNGTVTASRAFATVTLPLAEVKALAREHDATVNDIVLLLCSSALRRHYAKRRSLPKKSLVAAVPISLRAAGDTEADNQASLSLVSLGTHVADPVKRLGHVKAATQAMKAAMGSVKGVLPTDFPSLGVPWLMEAATRLYGKAKAAERLPQVANLVISNVPGPPVALYLAGAKMLTNYPASIVVHGLGLNITVQSYDQSLDFGLMADAQAMPDVKDLANALEIAFDDLRALEGESQAAGEGQASLIGRARRGLEGAVGAAGSAATRVAQEAMTRAVQEAVKQVGGQSGPSKKKRSPRSR
jgi:WS/DGAT/MGAT family acyltransferase